MGQNHEEGFENEEKYAMVLGEALADCPTLKARTVTRIIAHFDPEFISSLHAIRPCNRKLRYVGLHRGANKYFYGEPPEEFFRIGEEYESIDFNGSTYAIRGYGNEKKRIGCAYFERIT